MGLVDDEQDRQVSFLDETLDLVLDLAQGQGAGPLGSQAELEGELAAEVGRVDEGVVQVDGADLIGMELVAQPPQGGGLAAAGLAGEQAEGAGVDQVAQTGVELLENGGPEELLGA